MQEIYYVYSPTIILRCFVVRLWFRLDSNNALHIFLNMDCQYNHKLALACGLVSIRCRRKFDRRLKTISTDIKGRISTMGYLFVSERLAVDPSITAIDSIHLKAKGIPININIQTALLPSVYFLNKSF